MHQETDNRAEVAWKMQERLRQLSGHVRNDIDSTRDDGLRAALETSQNVLEGLEKAFARHARENPNSPEQP